MKASRARWLSQAASGLAAMAFVAGTAASALASAYTYDHLGVDAIISETPQIEQPSPQPPGGHGYIYYRVKATHVAGWVVPNDVQAGVLAGNRSVLVVPLEPLATRGSSAALVWSGTPGAWQYAGYIPPADGRLRFWIEAGYVQILTSARRYARYTVHNNGKLAEVESRTLAPGERLPPWLYLEPGARAFLGTDGEDAAVAIVCAKPGPLNESCGGRTEGTPIVVDAIASNGKACVHGTSIKIHAADGSWKGYVNIDAIQAPIPAGTLLRLRTDDPKQPSQTFGKERKTGADPGSAIDATLRVAHFYPATNDPSDATRDTSVTVTSGPLAGTHGWIFAQATTLQAFWVPPAMVCANDDRLFSLP